MFKTITSLFQKENLIVQALNECHEMLALDWDMFRAATESLRRTIGSPSELDIRDADKRVNKFERDVRRKVITHLTLTGDDVSSGLIVVSVVIDIERIGDYTKNIYELAQTHSDKLEAGGLEPQLVSLESRVGDLFQRTALAFKNGDEDSARQIMGEYKEELAADCDAIIDAVVAGKTEDLKPGQAAAVALYVRYLKRIGSHLRTIVTSVVNPFPRIGYKEKQL
ncbi:MAG: phosphate transport system protein [Limisphaerales bacterium]|jgi:phosphate transport system protein